MESLVGVGLLCICLWLKLVGDYQSLRSGSPHFCSWQHGVIWRKKQV